MPHQHHFLSRLDRVSGPHVELALSLYREPELVRYVLGQVRLPEQAPRVALSLADPARGPFLVVTREGIFVTCLGEGMSTGDLPVVPRGQLDGLLGKAEDLRARAEVFRDVAGQIGGVQGLFRRLYEAGDEVSREEMTAASAVQPLYAFDVLRLLLDAIVHLDQARDVLLPLMRQTKKLRSEWHDLLRAFWKSSWLVGHLTLLLGLSGPRAFDELPPKARDDLLANAISWGAVRQGAVGIALRGAWAAARIGKVLLPAYKHKLAGCETPLTCLDAVLPLGAMAFRHRGLRAEIEKALASAATSLKGSASHPYPALAVSLASSVFKIAATGPEAIEAMEADQADMGAGVAVAIGRNLPAGSPYAFERREDVPRDIALALPATLDDSLIEERRLLLPVLTMLPWVARASIEELYLPRDYLRATRCPWEPEHAYRLLRPLAEMYRQRQARPEGPARKGPCPCGSGKKYKRCCGETTVE